MTTLGPAPHRAEPQGIQELAEEPGESAPHLSTTQRIPAVGASVHEVTAGPSAGLTRLLRGGDLAIHFQPVVCLKQQRVIGLEALARPEAVTVVELFTTARRGKALLELDRHCRRLALQSYAALAPEPDGGPLLFLNFEASVLDTGVAGSGALLEATRKAGVDPRQVVIEINESVVGDTEALIQFVETHRRHGFLIALDDLGTGHSNLPRISQLRPDVIKLDRSLIAGIEEDFFQQETVKSLTHLSRSIGCLVLAEGIETLPELDCCASLGADLFQGFYFGRPGPPGERDDRGLEPLLQQAGERLRDRAVAGIRQRHATGQRMSWIVEQGCRRLQGADRNGFDEVLATLVATEGGVEAAYLLDSKGIQVGDTHLRRGTVHTNTRLFAPGCRGSDHSTKEYFYSLIGTGLTRFTTDNYISLATGHLCRTVAMWLDHPDGDSYVLCIDLKL